MIGNKDYHVPTWMSLLLLVGKHSFGEMRIRKDFVASKSLWRLVGAFWVNR